MGKKSCFVQTWLLHKSIEIPRNIEKRAPNPAFSQLSQHDVVLLYSRCQAYERQTTLSETAITDTDYGPVYDKKINADSAFSQLSQHDEFLSYSRCQAYKRQTTLSETAIADIDYWPVFDEKINAYSEFSERINICRETSKASICRCSKNFPGMTRVCTRSKPKTKWRWISLNEPCETIVKFCTTLSVPHSTSDTVWIFLTIQWFTNKQSVCNSGNPSNLPLILIVVLCNENAFAHRNSIQCIILFQVKRQFCKTEMALDTFRHHVTQLVDSRKLHWHASDTYEDVVKETYETIWSVKAHHAKICAVSLLFNSFDIYFQNVSLNDEVKKPLGCYYSPVDSQPMSLWTISTEESQNKSYFLLKMASRKRLTQAQLKTYVILKFQVILSECQILVQTMTKLCEHSFARDIVKQIKISVTSGLQVALFEIRQSVNKVHLVQFFDKLFCRNQMALTNTKENDVTGNELASVNFDCSLIVRPCHDKRNKIRQLVNSFLRDNSPVCSLTSKTNPSIDVQHNKHVPTDNGINENGHSLTITKSATKDKMQNEEIDKAILKTALLDPDYLPIPKNDITVANVLGPIFQRMSGGSNPGAEETMKYELLRLCTLRNYPKEDKPYLIRLAAAGFYYAANGDEVVCYCCGVRRHGWTAQCVPMSVHKRLSPKCPFLTRNPEVNVPVPETTPIFMNKHPLLRELIEEEEDEGYDTDISAVPRPGCHLPNTVGNGPTSNGQGLSNTNSAATSRSIAPKHPHYGVKYVRINSFVGWPKESCQDPEVLAEAGFYFAGIGDCVRCFQCGVGLRHWAAEDDPWVEHARWTLNNPCPYLILRKGEEFVNLVRMAVEIVSTDSNSAPQHDANAIVPQEAVSEHNSPVAKVTTQDSTAAKTQTKTELANTKASSALKANDPKKVQTNTTQSAARRQTGNRQRSSVQAKGSLTEEQRRIARENDLLRRQNVCCVCFERDVCIVFLPCCHLVTCAECAPALRICPVEKCRKVVKGTVKTFMS